MPPEKFSEIRSSLLDKLKNKLAAALTYHNVHHVEDVLVQALRIAEAEGIRDKEDLFLLKTACLYHDSGFLSAYQGHEEESCRIAEEDLPRFGVLPRQISRIRGLIMATRIPQLPQDRLGEILCDADLDYLGRDDFYPIAETLFSELKAFHFVGDRKEWNRIQVSFLASHHYFTGTSIRLRNERKLNHLEELRRVVAAE